MYVVDLQVSNHLRFTQCELCYQLKQSIAQAPSLEIKLAAVLQYRQHLSDQYSDRCIAWALQELALDPMSDICVMMTDGLDQGKFCLPRDPALRASAAAGKLRQNRPRIKVHGLWVFGCLALGFQNGKWVSDFASQKKQDSLVPKYSHKFPRSARE